MQQWASRTSASSRSACALRVSVACIVVSLGVGVDLSLSSGPADAHRQFYRYCYERSGTVVARDVRVSSSGIRIHSTG